MKFIVLFIVILGLLAMFFARKPQSTNGQTESVNNDAKIDTVIADKFLYNTDKDEKQKNLMTWEELNKHVEQMNRYIADHKMYSFTVTPDNPMEKQVTEAMKKSKIEADKLIK